MKTTIKNPVTKWNVIVRCNTKWNEKWVNQKTSQEAKRSKVKNKSSYLSIKQSMAIQLLTDKVEKGGNINLWEILTEVWYSKNTAKTPQKVFWKEIVQKTLKKFGINPAWIREAHEYLMNSKSLILYTSSNQFPAEKMIKMYKKHLGWICMTYVEDELKQTRTYEMLVQNDKNIIKSLQLAYRYLPYHDTKSEKTKYWDTNNSSKALEKIRALAESKWLHIKKPASIDH